VILPIIDVDKAKTVLVNKRSMSPGFAGIENELYYACVASDGIGHSQMVC